MSGEYIFNFVPDAYITPIVVHPGEFNSTTVSNKLQILQTSNDGVLSVYGDFIYRFASGTIFSIINSTTNVGTYTVVESQYLPKSEIVGIDTQQKTLTIRGNGSKIFNNRRVFTVQSSTFNNGKWMSKTSTFDGTNTVIQLLSSSNGDAVPPSIQDGNSIESAIVDGFVETAVTAIVVEEPLIDSVNDGILEYYVPNEEVGSSLSLPGRGAPNPGEHINRNMLDLLSNYASTIPPNNPISGQLWYDMHKINVWDPSAESWVAVGFSNVTVDREFVEPMTNTTLIATPPYELGSGVLSMYRNRLKLYPSIDYTEVSSGLVSLSDPSISGDQFMIEVIRLV